MLIVQIQTPGPAPDLLDSNMRASCRHPGDPATVMSETHHLKPQSVWLEGHSFPNYAGDFPGSPVVKTPPSQSREHGFDPWSGNYRASQVMQW